MEPPPVIGTVAVFGSCVTRDAFDLAGDGQVTLGEYFARSTVGSAFASDPVPDEHSSALQSTFQRRQVRRDFAKTLRASLQTLAFDLLIVDFTDERFPMFRLKDGRLVTVSSELRSTGFPGRLEGEWIAAFTDAHFECWLRGWSTLLESLREQGRIDRLRVNGVRWARHTVAGAGFAPAHPPATIDLANRHFSRLYDRVTRDLGERHLYRYDAALMVGADVHKWGPAPFHYVRAMYEAMMSRVLADLGRRPAGLVEAR